MDIHFFRILVGGVALWLIVGIALGPIVGRYLKRRNDL